MRIGTDEEVSCWLFSSCADSFKAGPEGWFHGVRKCPGIHDIKPFCSPLFADSQVLRYAAATLCCHRDTCFRAVSPLGWIQASREDQLHDGPRRVCGRGRDCLAARSAPLEVQRDDRVNQLQQLPEGWIKRPRGRRNCTQCYPGEFADEKGCLAARVRRWKYSATTGSTNCSSCPKGWFKRPREDELHAMLSRRVCRRRRLSRCAECAAGGTARHRVNQLQQLPQGLDPSVPEEEQLHAMRSRRVCRR